MSKFNTYKSEVITAVITCLLMFVLFLGFLLYNTFGVYVEEKYNDGYQKCVDQVKQAQQQNKVNSSTKNKNKKD